MAAWRYEINTNEIPNHFTLIVFFGVKGAIYYVAITKVIFSHAKISSFRTKAHLVFHWCLYNKNQYFVCFFVCLYPSSDQSTFCVVLATATGSLSPLPLEPRPVLVWKYSAKVKLVYFL